MGRLAGKVAVITGAGSGMGRAMAQRFVEEGAHVVCADISGAQDAVAAALGDAAIAVHCDVAEEAEVEAMIAAAVQRFGKLDILCNNAGFGGGMAPLAEQSTENWDRVHSVNIRGVFFGMKHGILAMLKTGGGSIINTGSASAVVGWKGHSIYGAAKAGVHQMTKAAALDYGKQGIRINAIAPGTMWTGLVPQSRDMPVPPADGFRLAGIPMDRWGSAMDIANAALFLASDEANYITGVILPVDGGYCIGFSGMGGEYPGTPGS
jgi:NAD(P)-dependent dehydrogenase (short-subunit alcohol dehydrogenase family)